jgi:hypothetical protein
MALAVVALCCCIVLLLLLFQTHIVVPFYEGQLPKVLANFDTWDTYPPCTTHPQAEVDLVFFLSRDANIRAVKKTILRRVYESAWSVQCFKSISVTSANMTAVEDSYWLGSRVQFDKFLKLQFLSHPAVVRYVMYMEPDCYIFRPNWLPLLQKTCLEEKDEFYIKGHRSMPRFNLTYNHINGNALYNLGDATLTNFYFYLYSSQLRTQENAGGASRVWHLAYDMDIHHVLDTVFITKSGEEVHIYKNIRDKVISSDFIQNYFHMNYSLSEVAAAYPSAFIVHGGHRVREGGEKEEGERREKRREKRRDWKSKRNNGAMELGRPRGSV